MRARDRIGILLFALSVSVGPALAAETAPETSAETPKEATKGSATFLDEFSGLRKFLFSETDTNLRFGVGISPVMIMKNKAGFSANLIEVHWIKESWDWTVFSASYGTTLSGEPLSAINAFTFRTIPKIRISSMLSAGIVAGWELISFPEVTVRLSKNNLNSPPEPLSKRGFILGGALSENFRVSNRFQLKLSQLVYKQTYDPEGTTAGWTYYYTPDELNQSKDAVSPGMVFILDVSLIY